MGTGRVSMGAEDRAHDVSGPFHGGGEGVHGEIMVSMSDGTASWTLCCFHGEKVLYMGEMPDG
ncbi:MAG: hypothetical protein GY765_16845 [bacterium]|nr:hypothetical protein [bacterium]